MATLELTQTQSLQTRQELKLIFRLEQANLLEMPEGDFSRLISEVENGFLFKRLYQKEKIIRYQRLPRTDLSSHFCPLKEEMVVDRGSLDVESLLLNKEHLVGQIQRMGLEKFKRYFLYPDEPELTIQEIAQQCNLDVSQVQEMESLINEFSVLSEFYHPSSLGPEQGTYYTRVASVERGPEGFVLGYYSPSFARGRYSINYERFEELKKSGIFSDNEAKEAKQLFRKLELINTRKNTITKVLQGVVEKQALYFESGDPKALLPFSQKELAQKIGLSPSSVSRAIAGRSIVTLWSAEVPLKRFFPRPREFRKGLLRHLLETDKKFSSDEAIRSKLWEKFGVAISRRSVANLRKELEFPPSQGKWAPCLGQEIR